MVREDPVRRGLLYAGTENGVYVSFSDGETWQPLQNNLPHAPVYWITVQENFRDLVIGTYGRGFWILDDITRLRDLSADVTAKAAHFFPPRPTYRFRGVEAIWAPLDDPVAGDNPPDGAALDFWLSTAPKDSVTIRISNSSGTVVRTMKVSAKAGGNRAWWDLGYDLTKEAKLRTQPLFTPELRFAPEGKAAPGLGRMGVLAPPGTYSVQLAVGDVRLQQPLTILKDPNSGGSLEDITAQTAFMTDVTTDLNASVDMINALEVVRSQVAVIKASLSGDSTRKDVVAATDSIDRKMLDVEEQLLQMRITGRGQDIVRWPMKVAEQLMYLAGSAGGLGSRAGGAASRSAAVVARPCAPDQGAVRPGDEPRPGGVQGAAPAAQHPERDHLLIRWVTSHASSRRYVPEDRKRRRNVSSRWSTMNCAPIARGALRQERPDHSLQATDLVHEAYLRLMAGAATPWDGRRHFFHAAGEAMRRILIEHARKRGRVKRGGQRVRVDLSGVDLASEYDVEQVLALDDVFQRLEKQDPQAATSCDCDSTLASASRRRRRHWTSRNER